MFSVWGSKAKKIGFSSLNWQWNGCGEDQTQLFMVHWLFKSNLFKLGNGVIAQYSNATQMIVWIIIMQQQWCIGYSLLQWQTPQRMLNTSLPPFHTTLQDKDIMLLQMVERFPEADCCWRLPCLTMVWFHDCYAFIYFTTLRMDSILLFPHNIKRSYFLPIIVCIVVPVLVKMKDSNWAHILCRYY